MPPRRGAQPPRRARLFGLAGLVVLGIAFGLGFLAGRHWESFPVLRRAIAVAKTTGGSERELQTRRGGAGTREGERAGRAPEPTPTLTFYQELTKPLAPPPPPPKRERPARPERVDVRAAGRSTAEASGEKLVDVRAAGRPGAPREASPAAGAFTVQVAAYRTRAQAEALRGTLAAAGHDAYVVEAETAGGVAYRVRVGAYATREAARAAAQAIAGERQLQAYVTAR
jgi:cell division protein FtsN